MVAATSTGVAAAAATSAMGGMGGMGGDDMASMMGGCKISMLWNWNTVDSCFISSSWRVTSEGMFAGSCIGVILLVMSLELLRRAVKEYDRFILRQHQAQALAHPQPQQQQQVTKSAASPDGGASPEPPATFAVVGAPQFRPNVIQQAVRALLHTLQFAVAYFIMLLAMYYNGYIIICIFIGAYLGSFIFQWESLGGSQESTSASREATVCCG